MTVFFLNEFALNTLNETTSSGYNVIGRKEDKIAILDLRTLRINHRVRATREIVSIYRRSNFMILHISLKSL